MENEEVKENYIAQEIVKFNVTDAALSKYEADYMPLSISGIDDKDGYQKVYEARIEIKTKKSEVEKKRKELKSPVLDLGKAIDKEAKRIAARLLPIEEHLKAEQSKIDVIKEEISAKKKKEASALAQTRIDEVSGLNGHITYEQAFYFDEEQYDEFLSEVRIDYNTEQARIELEAIAAEAKTKQQKDDRDAEEARLETVREEQRIEKEKLETERKELEAAKEKARLEEVVLLKEKMRQQEKTRLEKEALEKAAQIKQEKADKEHRRKIVEQEKESVDRAHAAQKKLEAVQEKARLEKEKLDEEIRVFKADQARVVQETFLAERKVQEIKDRIAQKKLDAERKIKEEKIYQARLEKEKQEALENAEFERVAAEDAEKERVLFADLEAKRQDALRPDKEKILEFGRYLVGMEMPEVIDAKAVLILLSAQQLLVKIHNHLVEKCEKL